MALSITAVGTNDVGAAVFTGLTTATPLTIFPCQNPGPDPRNAGTNFPIIPFYVASGRESEGIVLSVAATAAFNLDYQFSPDGGTTWYIGLQIASATVTVDGGAAGYTQIAAINMQVGFQFRVQIYGTAGTFNGAYEWRYYSDTL